jgi:uncharacterized protein YjbJ (UPF0337 family)
VKWAVFISRKRFSARCPGRDQVSEVFPEGTTKKGDAKDAAKQAQHSHEKAAAEQADQTRGKISQSIDGTKNNVKDKIEDLKERHLS